MDLVEVCLTVMVACLAIGFVLGVAALVILFGHWVALGFPVS